MNNRPVLIAALLLGGATLLTAASLAADAPNRSEQPEHAHPHPDTHTHQAGRGHKEIDLNEAARHATEVFDRIDSNTDQHISQAELAAAGPMAFGHGGHGGRGGRHGGKHAFGMHAFRMHRQGSDGPMPDGHAGMPPPPFEDALPPGDDDDANQNAVGHAGRPSREELQLALFARLDADKDGRLTAGEFANLAKVRRDEMLERGFKRMDRDGDGVLSRTEFPPMQARVQALDSNHDGKVSGDEFRARGPHRAAPRG